MWVDDEGIAHTVALPDPVSLMSDEFRVSLDALVSSQRSMVEDALETAEAAVFQCDLSSLFVEEIRPRSDDPRIVQGPASILEQ